MAINVVIKSLFDESGIKEAEKAFAGFGQGVDKAFRAVSIGAGIAGAAIGKFGVDSIKAASDLAESTNAVNVAFGDAARSVLRLGETSAESMGVSQTAFNQAAVRFSAFAERVVGSGGDVAGFISDISTRAADFASVFNIEVAEALQVFQSGLSGEAEPLKRFGINLLDTEVKAFALRTEMIKQGETLTEVQKVQARYGLLMESTNKTAGDFANTSEGLANTQRILTARFTDLQAEVGTALLPAVTELVSELGERLLPVFEELGEFLASPQGKKMIEDTAQAISDFAVFLIENIDDIADFAVKLIAAIAALKLLKGALELATTAQLIFNVAVKANPYIIAASAIALLIGGIFAFSDAAVKSGLVTTKSSNSLEAYAEESRRLKEAFEDGLIPADKYKQAQEDLKKRFEKLIPSVEATAGELNRLNNIKLNGLRNQLKDTAGELNRFRNIAAGIDTDAGGGGGGGGTGETAAEKRQKAFEKTQKFIKDAQEDLAKAQDKFNESIANAQKKYADSVAKTRADFAKRLSDIELQSQNRLREVFRQSAAMSVNDFLSAFNQAEKLRRDAFEQAQEEAKKANKAFTDVFVGTDPIQAYLKSLRSKLEANRQTLALSTKLFEKGFSQVFIEQIIASGSEGGVALGEALLASGPETIAEIQSLFTQINDQAETGMDALAREIFDKAGFATRELRNLYADTQSELAEALLKLKQDFDQEVLDTNIVLVDAIKEIRKAFSENIASMKGELGGLGNVVKDFYDKLTKAEMDAAKALVPTIPGAAGGATGGATGGGPAGVNVLASSVTNATGILIDSINDLEKVRRYFEERIVAASEFAAESITRGNLAAAASAQATRDEMFNQLRAFRAQGTAAVGTVININVKTDSTQSLAMVGKTLGNTITKYVQSGGQVVVSPVG